jgi:uncharacterized protein
MKNTFILSIALLISSLSAFAQNEKTLLINSGDLLQKGIEAHDNGDYKEAISYYKQITRNDTNYVIAMSELGLSYLADSQYTEAIHVLLEALKDPQGEESNIYNTLGSAYDDNKQYDLAIEAYYKGLTYAPYDFLLWFNIGITYDRMEKPDKAFEAYKKALQYNPFHAGSLNRIGKIELTKGHTVTAMMAFYLSLTCEPHSRYVSSNITQLDEICNVKLATSNGSSTRKSDNFYDIEIMIASKIALSSKYKNQAKIADAMVNQTQLMIDKIEYVKSDTGFFMQTFVPYYIALKEKGYFAPFIYQSYSATTSTSIQAAYKKNAKTITAFKLWVYDYWNKKREQQTILVNGVKQPATFYYFSNNKLQSIGEYNNRGTESATRKGAWVFYYKNGYKEAEGVYNDGGKRDGVWKFYYSSGELENIINYKDGDYNGLYESYCKNGQVTSKMLLVSNKIQGSVELYDEAGNLLYEKNIKDNEQDGLTTKYFLSGGVDSKLQYDAGALQGEQLLYYSSGALKKKLIYKNDLLDGDYIEYYESGVLKQKGKYTAGKYTGVWLTYYENKQVSDSGAYNAEGYLVGKWVEYYETGVLKQEVIYDLKGKKLGEQREYDKDGKLHGVFVFASNKISSYTQYDKKGNVVITGKEKGGVLTYKGYYPDGKTLAAEGIFKDGLKEGEWKYYNQNNYLESKNKYSKGELDGLSVYYYSSGVIETEKNFKNGYGDGLYKSYYKNKQLEVIGYLVEDDKQGYWIGYYPNGNKSYENYYVNGVRDRYMVNYSVSGLKKSEELYEYGFLKEMIHYDTLGAVVITNKIVRGNGEYKSLYPNGKVKAKYTFKNGSSDGILILNHPNGKLQESLNYTKGNRNGIIKGYDEDGNLTVEGAYKNDVRVGYWKHYYSNKKVETEGVYKNGSKDSLWITYFENGHKDFSVTWKMGNYNGPLVYYSPDLSNTPILIREYDDNDVKSYTYLGKDGKPLPAMPVVYETIEYKTLYPSGSKALEFAVKAGYREGPCVEYYSTGAVFKECNYVTGEKEGKSTEYFMNGKVSKEEYYLYDEKNGTCKEYYSNGTLKSVENYVYGELNGTCIYYDQTGKIIKKVFYRDGVLFQ